MSQFRNLVFEGGGVKGIAYAGAIDALDAEGILSDIKRTAGTSAGAITAALLAMGATGADVAEIVGHTSFRKFMDDSFGFVRDTKRFLNEYGWYKGDSFSNWMKKLVYNFAGDSNLSFAGLRALSESDSRRFRDLHVVGTNLSMQMPQVYSADETPDVPIWLGVRISMSIPLFFAAVQREDQVHVDGGVTWNYPVDIFDDEKFVDQGPQAFEVPTYTRYDATHVYNKETLGFRADTRDEIRAEKEGWRRPPIEIDNILDYSKVLVGFLLDMANKVHLHANDWHRTVFIDADGVGTTDFDLPDSAVQVLVENGKRGVQEYLAWFRDENQRPANRV